MQTGGNAPLFRDGVEQGKGVTASYIGAGWAAKKGRPDTEAFDGTWVKVLASMVDNYCAQVLVAQ